MMVMADFMQSEIKVRKSEVKTVIWSVHTYSLYNDRCCNVNFYISITSIKDRNSASRPVKIHIFKCAVDNLKMCITRNSSINSGQQGLYIYIYIYIYIHTYIYIHIYNID